MEIQAPRCRRAELVLAPEHERSRRACNLELPTRCGRSIGAHEFFSVCAYSQASVNIGPERHESDCTLEIRN